MKKLIFSFLILVSFIFSQNIDELKEIREQLKIQFWKLKERNLKTREQLKNQITLLNESIRNGNERRNSLVEEFFLIQENLSKIKEILTGSEIERNSFVSGLNEIILEEKDKLKSSLPFLIRRNTPRLNNLEQKILAPLNKASAILDYKLDLISLSESVEIYRHTQLNPQNNKSVEVEVLRIGFIGSMFSDNQGFNGFLIRKTGLGGIGYEWLTNLPSNQKKKIENSLSSAINNQNNDKRIDVALDPVQAGEKLKSLLSNRNLNVFQSVVSFIQSGGIIMYPLILLGLFSLFIILERLNFYKKYDFKKNQEFLKFLNQFDKSSLKKEINFDLGKQKPLFLFMKNLFNINLKEIDKLEKNIEEKINSLEVELNSKLTTLGVLGTIAPLLGLLGTVSGMITLFDVITVYGTSNPKILAGGISIALITTQTGLSLAIPILILHHYLVRKRAKIVNFIEEKAVRFINLKRD